MMDFRARLGAPVRPPLPEYPWHSSYAAFQYCMYAQQRHIDLLTKWAQTQVTDGRRALEARMATEFHKLDAIETDLAGARRRYDALKEDLMSASDDPDFPSVDETDCLAIMSANRMHHNDQILDFAKHVATCTPDEAQRRLAMWKSTAMYWNPHLEFPTDNLFEVTTPGPDDHLMMDPRTADQMWPSPSEDPDDPDEADSVPKSLCSCCRFSHIDSLPRGKHVRSAEVAWSHVAFVRIRKTFLEWRVGFLSDMGRTGLVISLVQSVADRSITESLEKLHTKLTSKLERLKLLDPKSEKPLSIDTTMALRRLEIRHQRWERSTPQLKTLELTESHRDRAMSYHQARANLLGSLSKFANEAIPTDVGQDTSPSEIPFIPVSLACKATRDKGGSVSLAMLLDGREVFIRYWLRKYLRYASSIEVPCKVDSNMSDEALALFHYMSYLFHHRNVLLFAQYEAGFKSDDIGWKRVFDQQRIELRSIDMAYAISKDRMESSPARNTTEPCKRANNLQKKLKVAKSALAKTFAQRTSMKSAESPNVDKQARMIHRKIAHALDKDLVFLFDDNKPVFGPSKLRDRH